MLMNITGHSSLPFRKDGDKPHPYSSLLIKVVGLVVGVVIFKILDRAPDASRAVVQEQRARSGQEHDPEQYDKSVVRKQIDEGPVRDDIRTEGHQKVDRRNRYRVLHILEAM